MCSSEWVDGTIPEKRRGKMNVWVGYPTFVMHHYLRVSWAQCTTGSRSVPAQGLNIQFLVPWQLLSQAIQRWVISQLIVHPQAHLRLRLVLRAFVIRVHRAGPKVHVIAIPRRSYHRTVSENSKEVKRMQAVSNLPTMIGAFGCQCASRTHVVQPPNSSWCALDLLP